jgi:hypothetical protein
MPVTINGTSGVVSPDGSAGTPAYQGSDANTGMFFPAADTIAFAEGGAEVARFNSSGNFGLGITPSAWGAYTVLQNKNFSLGGFDYGQGILTLNGYYDGSTWRAIDTGAATQYKHFVGQHQWFTAPSASAGGALTWTQAMTLDASGNLLVATTGTTAVQSNTAGAFTYRPAGQLEVNASGTQAAFFGRTNDGMVVGFYSGGTRRGSVDISGATTSYVTSSDYRLKEDIQPMTGALAKVAALKPVTYKWKFDGSDGQGFIAHELQAVVPDCVTGEKDAVDADGKPVYQGIDTSFLVATLTAAIQELTARVQALESQA